MAAQHTPGPWEAHHGVLGANEAVWDVTRKGDGWYACDATPEGWFVATVHEVRDAASAAANARLIAASPELLDLAYQYLSDLRRPPTGDSLQRRIERAEKLVAKATGAA